MNDQDAAWKIVRTEPDLIAILNPAQKALVGLKKTVDAHAGFVWSDRDGLDTGRKLRCL